VRYLKVLLVIIPACCGLALVGAAISYALRPIQAAQPAPLASPMPVPPKAIPIQLPTATQPATFTPVPPSPIPAATKAPTRPATIQAATATNLPQPAINPTISAYAAQVLVQFEEYNTALHSFYTLNQSASNDPQLMLDNEWKTNMVVALATMQIYSKRLASIESSAPELSKTRDYLSKIDTETKLLATNYARGIDNLDKDSINAAIRNLENINTYLSEATKEMRKVSGVP
jgi:hypothetical protein